MGSLARRGKWWGLLVALTVAAVAVTGCTGGGAAETGGATEVASEVSFPVTVIDDAGREVTIESEPRRIVSLAPSNTEILAGLGLLDRLVGVTTFDDYPPEVTDLPKVGDFVTPNLEAIAAAEPDLVLVTGGVQSDVIGQLEGLGAAVLAVDPQTLPAVLSSIEFVGKATGRVDEAAALVQSMEDELAEIAQAVADEERVPVFLEIAQEPLFTPGSGTLMDDLISAAGGSNVVSGSGFVPYSIEQLIEDDPGFYLATKGSMSDPADLKKRAGYAELSAVRDGHVAVLDDNLVSRPGPRVVQGVRQIAEALHPEAFGK